MKSIFSFIMLTLASWQLTASHIVGGDLHYEYLGNNQYLIVMKIYRDCAASSTDFDNPAAIGIYNANNVLVENLEIPLSSAVITDMDPNTGNPCLNAPLGICVKQAIFSGTVTLPPSEGGYTLAYQRCCRNTTIVNTESNDDIGITLTTQIPGPEIVAINSNPSFNEFPPIVICINEQLEFDHSATDIDGDSIVYELCNPLLTNVGGFYINPPGPPPYPELIFNPGYSYLYPIDASPAFTIDDETGLLTGTPTQLGQYVIGVCMREYRNGVLLSTTNRDFQFNITNCGQATVADFQDPGDCQGLNVSFNNTSFGATEYAWDFGVEGTDTDVSASPEPEFIFPQEGEYTITLIANPGFECADTMELAIGVYEPFLIDDIVYVATCEDFSYDYDFSLGTIQVSNDATIEWSFENGFPATASGGEVNDVFFLGSTSYFVEATASNAFCESSTSIEVIPPVLPFSDIEPQTVFCEGLTIDFAIGNTNATEVLWDFGQPGNSDVSSSFNPTFTYDEYGTYTVTVISDPQSDCPGQSTSIVAVFPPDPIQPNYTIAVGSVCDESPEVSVDAADMGATSVTWLWGDGSSSTELTTGHVYPGNGTFTITLIAVNDVCDVTVNYLQYVQFFPVPENTEVLIPNVFTPNRDGKNELFRGFFSNEAVLVTNGRTYADYFSYYRLLVYNRWGGLIYDSEADGSYGWNGVYNDEVAEGTYYYIFEYMRKCIDTDIQKKEGHLELLRD